MFIHFQYFSIAMLVYLRVPGISRNGVLRISSARGSQDSSTPDDCVTLLAGVPTKDVMVLTRTFFTLGANQTTPNKGPNNITPRNTMECWMACWHMLVGTLCTLSLSHYWDVQYQMHIRAPKTHKQGNPSFTTACPTGEWQLTLPSKVPKFASPALASKPRWHPCLTHWTWCFDSSLLWPIAVSAIVDAFPKTAERLQRLKPWPIVINFHQLHRIIIANKQVIQ